MARPISKRLLEAIDDTDQWPRCQNKKCGKLMDYETYGNKSYTRWQERRYCSKECKYEGAKKTIGNTDTSDVSKWPVCQNRDCRKPIPFDKKRHQCIAMWRKRQYCDNLCHVNELSYKNYIEVKECEKCGAPIDRKKNEEIKKFRYRKRCDDCQEKPKKSRPTQTKYDDIDKRLAETSKPIAPGFSVVIHHSAEFERKGNGFQLKDYELEDRNRKVDAVLESLAD